MRYLPAELLNALAVVESLAALLVLDVGLVNPDHFLHLKLLMSLHMHAVIDVHEHRVDEVGLALGGHDLLLKGLLQDL